MEHDEFDDIRMVVVVNKKLEIGKALNAVLHLGVGLTNFVGESGREQLKFIDFKDADGGSHQSISARSFVVLRGTSSDIRKLRKQALELGVPVCDFIESMTGGSYIEQIEKTNNIKEELMTYYGVVLMGQKETLHPMTRKLSLWT